MKEYDLNGVKFIYDNLIGVIFTDNNLDDIFNSMKIFKRINQKKLQDSLIKGSDDFTYFSIEDKMPVIITNLEMHEIDLLRKAFYVMSKTQIESIMYPLDMYYTLK